ncbi:uncharacterized protein LOC129597666 isoform X2 [Paramacrobiotus metropolitanus]|uniref:uncharacterized protein LOC129597666 isoform X2 n=1 Tax=Paramacrobiotus metropolitanus TaxID=2943436 RepID=UPI002445C4BA|nr:uncharacterized protein LOC129597666 isoform X2 [Paramacrobiotus metropolitanus]
MKELYQNGVAHRNIAKEKGISETNMRRIISSHGIPKRERKLATLLSPQQEDELVKFLVSLGPFGGKYVALRNLMEEFARENDMQCTFTYFWRDGFVRRNRQRLPAHFIKLLSPRGTSLTSGYDDDLDILRAMNSRRRPRRILTEDDAGVKEPSVWKQKPKLNVHERAVKETRKAFIHGGLTKEEANELLVRLRVEGIPQPVTPVPQMSSDILWVTAINNIFGETSGEPQPTCSTQEAVPEAIFPNFLLKAKIPPTVKFDVNRRSPMKKTAFQVQVLEKAFQKSTTCGDKRAKRLGQLLNLSPTQVIHWFHNTARQKRKMAQKAGPEGVVVQDAILEAQASHAMLGGEEGALDGGETMLESGEHYTMEKINQETPQGLVLEG